MNVAIGMVINGSILGGYFYVTGVLAPNRGVPGVIGEETHEEVGPDVA
jgi:hypothetical protein